MTVNFHYAPYYCEENVWFLCQEPQFVDLPLKVVIISNEFRTCPLWDQRAGETGNPVLWDYHVILLCNSTNWQVWDLDTTLGMPVDLGYYMHRTFFRNKTLEMQFALRVRVIPAEEYIARFSSDRSHMRDEEDRWLATPPLWPMILKEGGTALMNLIDMKTASLGVVMTLKDLERHFSTRASC
jgi:hypothetical protein